jgi:large subunit ribosomal protein L35
MQSEISGRNGETIKMPKMKTHKATAKRFRVTGTGKLKRTAQGKNHFHRNRSQERINDLTKPVIVEQTAMVKRVLKLAPWLDKK